MVEIQIFQLEDEIWCDYNEGQVKLYKCTTHDMHRSQSWRWKPFSPARTRREAPGLEWTSRKSKNELVEKYWGQWNEDYLRNTQAAEPSQPSRSPCTSHPISTHKEMTPKTFVPGWNLENWSQGTELSLGCLCFFVSYEWWCSEHLWASFYIYVFISLTLVSQIYI